MRLPNGTVINSALFKIDEYSAQNAFNKTYQNYPLRVGIIKKTIPSNSKQSISKVYPEYDVLVYEQNGPLGGTPTTYKNCLAAQNFGSIADYFEYSLRPQTKAIDKGNKIDAFNQDGALVLLLCINGQGDRGIIIGALNHPNRKTNLKPDEISLYFEYNGLKSAIDNDGAFNLTFQGATDSEGKPLNKDLGETVVAIEKDGSIQFKHKGITLRLDKTGKIVLAAQDQISITGQKGADITLKEDLKIKTESNISLEIKDMLIKASGSATVNFKSIQLKTDQNIEAKTNNLTINSQIATIKGTQITLDGLTFAGGAGGLPALSLLTQFLGVSAVGPVISSAIGPFATKTFIL